MIDQNKIGAFIRTLRKEKNMTQQELADQLGISDKAVSKWENGRGLPDYSLLSPLCEMLDVTPSELIKGEPQTDRRNVDSNDLHNTVISYDVDLEEPLFEEYKAYRKRMLRVKAITKAVLIMAAAVFAVYLMIDMDQLKMIPEEVYPSYQWEVPQLETETDGNELTISWNPIKDEESFSGYELYSSGDKDGEYDLIATVNKSRNLEDGKYVYKSEMPSGLMWYKACAVSDEGSTQYGAAIPMLHTSGRIVDVKEIGDNWMVEAEISNYTDLDLWLSTDPPNPDRPWGLVTAIGTKAYKPEEKVDLFDTALCDTNGEVSAYSKIAGGAKNQAVCFLIKGQGLSKYDINGCYVSIRTIGLDYRQPVSDEDNTPDDMPMFTINLDRNPDKFYCGANWFIDEIQE